MLKNFVENLEKAWGLGIKWVLPWNFVTKL